MLRLEKSSSTQSPILLDATRARKKSRPPAWDDHIFMLGKQLLKEAFPMGKGPGESSSNYIGLFIKNTLILFDVPPPPQFCISISFNFSGDLQSPEKKLKAMFMQNFGETSKSVMVFLKKAHSLRRARNGPGQAKLERKCWNSSAIVPVRF